MKTTPHRPSYNVQVPPSDIGLEYTANVPPMAVGPQILNGLGQGAPGVKVLYGTQGAPLGDTAGAIGNVVLIGLGVALGLGAFVWWRNR